MANSVILVFFGGALGAILRELVMLKVPNLADGFPLDILVANLLAAFVLGFVSALHSRNAASDSVNMFAGTGICGGLSTFSSFAFGMAVLTRASTASAVVAVVYMVVSLVLGYVAVGYGLTVGGKRLA
jgi:CrcB protein